MAKWKIKNERVLKKFVRKEGKIEKGQGWAPRKKRKVNA